MSRRFAWKLALAALALAAFFAAARLLPLALWLGDFQLWVQGRGLLGMALFLVVYVVVTLLMGPAWLLTVGAGLTWGIEIAVALVWVSATLGASASFLLGRTLMRRKVEAAARSHPMLGAVDRAVARKGWKIVFLLRLSPLVPYVLSNYVYGLTAIRFWPYVAASAFGMLPLTILYVAAGAAGRTALGAPPPGGPWKIAALAVGAVLTIGVTVWVTKIAKRELEAARETSP